MKKGDKVVIISGRDKGKTGKIVKTIASKNRLVVEGVCLVKKHIRRRSENETGGVKDIPASIHCSNVALFCSNCNRGVKSSIKVSGKNDKIRVCKRCQKEV